MAISSVSLAYLISVMSQTQRPSHSPSHSGWAYSACSQSFTAVPLPGTISSEATIQLAQSFTFQAVSRFAIRQASMISVSKRVPPSARACFSSYRYITSLSNSSSMKRPVPAPPP